MNVLITGATGFIGSHLVKALVDEGHHCRCLVRKTSNINYLINLNSVELFYGDITNRDSLKAIGEGIDIVYHLAAAGHVSAISNKAYQQFRKINVEGTRNVIEACLNYSIKKFVHFSSTAAMGLIKRSIVDENTPCQPKTPYQKSKRDSELIALDYWKRFNFPVVVLRPCMVYGPSGKGEFLKICKLIKKGWFPKIGRGKNLTPIVYVEDVVQAAISVGKISKCGEVYLIASENSYELDYIRNLILKKLEVNKPYPYIPISFAKLGALGIEVFARIFNFVPIVTYKNIDSTVTDRVFSILKAREQLEYRPKFGLEQGIGKTIKWLKENGLI